MKLVEEDAYAARVAREYADFVYIRRFTNFILATRSPQLWKETPLWASIPSQVRAQFILSVDFGIEAVYGARHACLPATWRTDGKRRDYNVGRERAETLSAFSANQSGSRKAQEVSRNRTLHHSALPGVHGLAVKLAERDVHFVQVAGNDEIMVTVVVPNAGPTICRQATDAAFYGERSHATWRETHRPWNAACESGHADPPFTSAGIRSSIPGRCVSRQVA